MADRIPGCPLPESITLQERLTQLRGRLVLVESEAGSFEAAPIREVRSNKFYVMDLTVRFDRPFFATVIVPPAEVTPVTAIVRVEGLSPGLGVKSGSLIRIGQDFVEFAADISGTRAVVIAPRNRFVTVTCEELPDE
ncbi:hypothetical protein [Tumebacillus flagellatus]|uniref:Uncharacterized protein n=1 Tax=Tumebacillus flagellatus TaxID=1157490 RepID=A0A074MDD2_9BACL|nr:hypothetical protein [Tumebacillus flagellatus]KEO83867.1 hypothetical protein EL26_08090 [Tumebacillus flagellatus]